VNRRILLFVICLALMVVIFIRMAAGKMAVLWTLQGLGVWIFAFFTLCVFSFLYKDNPFFKFAEHLAVGVSAGFSLIMMIEQTLLRQFITPFFGVVRAAFAQNTVQPLISIDFLVIVPATLGFFLFTRFLPQRAWLARWPIAFIWGLSAGAAIPLGMQGMIFKQLQASMVPLSFSWSGFNNLVIILGVGCCLVYFFFSKEHKGVTGGISKVGIYILMIGFGASFGFTVMSRISLLIGRIQFLMTDWLGVLH